MRRRYLRNKARGNIVYPGLIAAWSAKGKTNDDEDRAILKDLTGNGHDITLNGFAFSEMSGYEGYKLNFKDTSEFVLWKDRNKYTYSDNKIIITEINSPFTFLGRKYFPTDSSQDEWKFKITGISNTTRKLRVRPNIKNLTNYSIDVNTDGIYIIPKVEGTVVTENQYSAMFLFDIGDINTMENCNITIELLPEYPDALVFDGIDDYGINENMPILTDYTIIAKRKTNDGLGALLSKGKSTIGAFVFEGGSRFVSNVFSFGFGNKVDIINSDISYQSKKKYNDITISFGSGTDSNKILLGEFRFWQGAFYSAYLFDHSLDEQEIKAFIRKYIDANYVLPSEQTT